MLTHTPSRLVIALLALVLWLLMASRPVLAAPVGQDDHIYLPLIAGGNGAQATTPTPATPTPVTPTPVTPTPTTPTPTLVPSDAALIATALAQGQIDYGTSLLYRFYSLFADERLPQPLQGGGSLGEDVTLFAEAIDPTLPAAVQANLRPFLLRPDHPESIHSVRMRSATQPLAALSADVACDGAWAAQSSSKPGVKVRVHALCFNDYANDMGAALALIESLWTPMTNLMGAPIPDTGGTDGGSTPEIDFYLLDPLGTVWREGVNRGIRQGAMAVAPATEPIANGRSSGYVLLARSDIDQEGFKSTLAHEFFHILQKRHNQVITFHGTTEWWFVEASAKWAEWYFVPETSDTQVHGYFQSIFRPRDQSLHRSYDIYDAAGLDLGSSAYAGYIWPFFVQQEQGQASMGDIWKELEGVGTDWDKGMRVLDNGTLPNHGADLRASHLPQNFGVS